MTDDEYNEYCWSQLHDDDYRSLTEIRKEVPACAWCGGRYRHNENCCEVTDYVKLDVQKGRVIYHRTDEERAAFRPGTLNKGRYAGLTLDEVPRGWLEWALVKKRLDDHTAGMVRRYLLNDPAA